MVKSKCPNCGHVYDVKTRGELGGGTRRKIERVSKNKRMLLDIAHTAKTAMTVREFQRHLFAVKMGNRWQRGDKGKPTGRWNYHHTQAELSLLVGNDLLCMSRAKEYWTGDMYGSDPTPVYWMDPHQEQIFMDLEKYPKAHLRYLIRQPKDRGRCLNE